MLLAI